MMSRKNVLIWAFAAIAGVLLAVTPTVQGGDKGRVRLEGAWLITSPFGVRGLETMIPKDPSGKSAAVQLTTLSGDVTGLGCCPDAEYLSVGLGEAELIGPSTAEATFLAYGMKKGVPRDEIVCIWVLNGLTTFTSPNTQESDITFTFYPTTDADGDMLPDEGDEPCHIPIPDVPEEYWPTCVTLPFQGTRVPALPSCE